jgi:hypothetical protein
MKPDYFQRGDQMNKILWVMIILLLMPLTAPAASSIAPDWQLPSPEEYALLMEKTSHYENRVFGYSLDIPAAFYMLTEDELQQLFDGSNGSDVYDMRYFVSSEYMLSFEVQVKVPTYSSFEEECANAASYIDLLKGWGVKEPFLVHEGLLRKTQLGNMLEMAYGYKVDGTKVNVVYFDYYFGENEYIFYLEGYEAAYEILQPILARIVKTVVIKDAPVML